MIAVILKKELLEARRDGRVLLIAVLLGLLALGSLITGWSIHIGQQHQLRAAQWDDQATFVKQPEKSPHAAAHFGRLAHKPLPVLAVFDPGVSAYLGQVVWLEAHRQSPAMFRPAEDALEVRRLADLSIAGVLTILVPLLLFLAGHGAFAAERERGTLRQVMSAGLSLRTLFAGKLTALASIGLGACVVPICLSTIMAVSGGDSGSVWDLVARSVGLTLAYAMYALTFSAIAIVVSAHVRTARSALLMLLSLWAVSIIVVPRLAASVAERAHPTPDSGSFWRQTSNAIRTLRPERGSLRDREVERVALRQALGRDIAPSEIASLKINPTGLRLAVSELLDAEIYAEAYRMLFATYENQKRLRRCLSFLSPTIALQHVSSALAGTDVSAHQHFVLDAERHRHLIIRTMNEDMMLNGVGQNNDYVAGEALWTRVPALSYQSPRVSFAIRSAGWDFLILLVWGSVATWIASRSARALSPL